jgi:site-specific DNA-cytosine methylase
MPSPRSNPSLHQPYRVLDLASGIGGFTLGLIHSGLDDRYEVTTYCDNDPFCSRVLSENFKKPVLGDVRQVSLSEGEYDIIQASIPCQPHSQASGSYRKGSGDERDLGDEFIRLVGECKPSGFLLENVAGFRTSEKGQYFKNFLRKLCALDTPYVIEWGHYSAAQVGAVHLRKRFWVLGYRADTTPRTALPTTKEKNKNSFLPSSPLIERSLLTHEGLENYLPISCDTEDKPYRKAHLKAYGNAIVPRVASRVWKRFHKHLHDREEVFYRASFIQTHRLSDLGLMPSEGVLSPVFGQFPIFQSSKWGDPVRVKDKFYLPTPLSCNSIHPGHRSWKPGNNKHLPHALVPWRVPYTDRKHNDKLNPEFVRMMMGFPEGWLPID